MINRPVSEKDIPFLNRAIQVSKNARQNGNHPFGAILVNNKGEVILESENTVNTGHDVTNHAETNLVRASQSIEKSDLSQSTLYSSCEPCSMCSGAIYWSGITRVVYALSDEELNRAFISDTSNSRHEDLNKYQQKYNCRIVFEMHQNPVQVAGPTLIKKALEPHLGFWTKGGKSNPQTEIIQDAKLSLKK